MSSTRRANVVIVDGADILLGLEKWTLEQAHDLNIIWISKHVLQPVPQHLLPASVVCVTVPDREAVNLEQTIRLARGLGQRVLVSAGYMTVGVRQRAVAAGADRVMGDTFADVLQAIRELAGLVAPRPVTTGSGGRTLQLGFSAFEREVIRLQRAGLPPLLIAGQLEKSYDMVQPVIERLRKLTRAEVDARLALV